eukprot:366474-Chlamydomonas_euryale.AAC.15
MRTVILSVSPRRSWQHASAAWSSACASECLMRLCNADASRPSTRKALSSALPCAWWHSAYAGASNLSASSYLQWLSNAVHRRLSTHHVASSAWPRSFQTPDSAALEWQLQLSMLVLVLQDVKHAVERTPRRVVCVSILTAAGDVPWVGRRALGAVSPEAVRPVADRGSVLLHARHLGLRRGMRVVSKHVPSGHLRWQVKRWGAVAPTHVVPALALVGVLPRKPHKPRHVHVDGCPQPQQRNCRCVV